MNIILGCECSGTIRDAFLAAGHNAVSCDLKETEKPGPHIKDDILNHLNDGWDMAIFHPDCRFITVSQAWTFSPRFKSRFPGRSEQRSAAIRFAEKLWSAPIGKIVLENPVGFLSTMSALGKPSQIIQPYNFGNDASKATCLWLKNLPRLQKTEYVAPRLVNGRPRWANQTDSGQNRLAPGESRSADRARTYPGIAKAMAEQWGKCL